MTPKLRFPEFTDEWQMKKLGDLFEIKSASRVHKDEWAKSGVPFFRSSDVVARFKGEKNTDAFIPMELFEKLSSKSGRIRKGDLLVTGGGSIGIPYLVKSNEPLYFKDADLIWIKHSVHVAPFFLYSFLVSPKFRRYLRSISHIGTIGHYTIEQAKMTPMPLASIEEQEKIADFLTALDERIAVGEQKLKLLEDYKRGVMQKIFSQQIRFKDEDGKPYTDWEEKKMSEIFSEVTKRVGDKNLETYSITAGRGFVTQAEKFGKDISGMQNERYTLLEKDDFAYNKGNSKTYSYGCVYKNGEGKEIAVPNVFISFRLKDRSMLPDYFEQLFINHYLDKHLRKLISSGARMDGLLNVNKKDFFEIEVPVPGQDEQQKIADFLTTLDDKVAVEQVYVAAAKQWKKGLLQRMFI